MSKSVHLEGTPRSWISATTTQAAALTSIAPRPLHLPLPLQEDHLVTLVFEEFRPFVCQIFSLPPGSTDPMADENVQKGETLQNQPME